MWEELESEGLESFRLGVSEAVTGPCGKARDQSKVQESSTRLILKLVFPSCEVRRTLPAFQE